MQKTIIVLANSRKMMNRCIAGIDIDTGKWIRPCYGDGNDGIPYDIRQVNGGEPKLLDVIRLSLKKDGPNREYQPENRGLFKKRWEKIAEASIRDVIKYVNTRTPIFYNATDRVGIREIEKIPRQDRYSLCLIETKVKFVTGAADGKKRVYANFKYGKVEYRLTVTDFEFEKSFPPYSERETECLLTISLGVPYRNYCYKLVAGVIEI